LFARRISSFEVKMLDKSKFFISQFEIGERTCAEKFCLRDSMNRYEFVQIKRINEGCIGKPYLGSTISGL